MFLRKDLQTMANPKVALIMGSDSDFDKVKGCITKLKEFSVEVKVPFMQTIDDTTFSGKYDGKDVSFSSNVNFVRPDDIKFAESIPSEFKDVAILLMAIHDKNSDKTQE